MLNLNIGHYVGHGMHKMQNDRDKKSSKKSYGFLFREVQSLTEPNDVYLLMYDNRYCHIDQRSMQWELYGTLKKN